jgi:hypothetical protein
MESMNQRMSARKTEMVEQEGGVDTQLLSRIIRSPLKMTIEGIDDKGDIFFFVPIRHIGLTKSDLTNSGTLIKTRFFTDFVGELIVRYNIDDFTRYICEQVDPNQYLAMVSRTRHGGFGLFILEDDEAVRFQFHISFIQQILSEDISQMIK